MPDSLKSALIKASQQHYEELYEPETYGVASLQDALDEILKLFQGTNQTLSHLRYVWMALILASVVEPTVKYYQPNSSIAEETINRLALWLLENIGEMLNSKQADRVNREKEATTTVDLSCLFTDNKEIASFQVLSEALDVYSNAIKALDYNQSLEALLEILDDCLEGYAIFPGSYGRRELFDWWLLEVVPASWHLFAPTYIYSVDKLANEKRTTFHQMDNHQMDKLKKISSAMWSKIIDKL
jgi:hypothetical protein